MRRTNADKRRAVETLLRDDEWGKWSDNEIARRCGVSQPFVSKLRTSYNNYKIEPRLASRNGTTYEVNTGNIGIRTPQPDTDLDNEPLTPYEQAIADNYEAKQRAAGDLSGVNHSAPNRV